MNKAVLILIFAVSLLGCAHGPIVPGSCSTGLAQMEKADQDDRAGDINRIDWAVVSPRDLERRIWVAKVFAVGCFKEASDYANAAMIFQHGDTADHAFQAFIWAKRAVELGDEKQKSLMAMALDRYLVRSGQKQLFATQGSKPGTDPCWCLEPVETSFPETRRAQMANRDIPRALEWIGTLNDVQKNCGPAQYCDDHLKPTPAGTIPGFW